MKLQINANSPDSLKTTLECILNIASVFVGNGHIPTQQEIETPQQYGTFWWREDDRIHLYSTANDWWVCITGETETDVVLEFRYRYYRDNISDLLTQALGAKFKHWGVTIINE